MSPDFDVATGKPPKWFIENIKLSKDYLKDTNLSAENIFYIDKDKNDDLVKIWINRDSKDELTENSLQKYSDYLFIRRTNRVE